MIMAHSTAKSLDNKAMFDTLDSIYPERQLYSMSLDWRKDKQYILKARGVKGDVIVGWEEIEYLKEWSEAWC